MIETKKLKYDWPSMAVGDFVISDTPGTRHAAMMWAERENKPDIKFSSKKEGFKKYRIERIA